jgi:uncharacterized membrane protein
MPSSTARVADGRALAGSRLDALLVASIALVLAGIGISGYLTYAHYEGIDPACVGGSSGCHIVQSSKYAELAGVPVALIGLIGYVAIGASLAVRTELGRTITLGLAMGGAAFTVYLTYLELFVIDAICQWCVANAVTMWLLFIVSATRFVRGT